MQPSHSPESKQQTGWQQQTQRQDVQQQLHQQHAHQELLKPQAPQQQQQQEQQEQEQEHTLATQPKQESDVCTHGAAAAVDSSSLNASDTAVLVEPTNTAVLVGSEPPRQYKRQVTFPADEAIATVHHLYPSSSAGDLSSWHDEAVAEPQPPTGLYSRFKAAVKQLKRDVLALYYAVHDPRTPFLSKLLPWLVLAYALSPLDLIPDFIPVLGFLDDMLLLPLGLWLSYKLIPAEVMEDSRIRAAAEPLLLHKNWLVATLVFTLWCSGLLLLENWLIQQYARPPLQQWRLQVVGGSGVLLVVVFVVWVFMRVQYEKDKRDAVEAAGGPLLVGYDSSSDEGDV